ncbi:major facilitator superfamily domain-containing protein [Hyaloraphidium curvatum]|nr:major facilitator superfamily domain-containing protein [Hyaloraphidium curvatum]
MDGLKDDGPESDAEALLLRRRLGDGPESDDETLLLRRRTGFLPVELVKGYDGYSEVEGTIVRRIDAEIMPLVMVLYLFALLDRHSIGLARVAGSAASHGMEAELGLRDEDYGTCVFAFVLGYTVLEIPSNLLLSRFTPRFWLSRIMVSWGCVTVMMAFAWDFASLATLRFLLGVAESGFFPGILLYLTFWFRKSEQALRLALFMASASVAGFLGGVLAYVLSNLDGFLGLSGWRWIFLVEGIPSILLGFYAYRKLHNFPDSASFLTKDERELAVKRLGAHAPSSKDPHFDWEQFTRAVRDPVLHLFCAGYVCLMSPLHANAAFMPTILRSMGFSSQATLLLSAPPHLCGLLTQIPWALHSDRSGTRWPYVMVAVAMQMVGYSVMLAFQSVTVRYFACFLVQAGASAAVVIYLSWTTSHFSGVGSQTRTAVSTAAVVSVGNLLAGFVGSYAFKASDAPGYRAGFTQNIIFNLLTLGCVAVLKRWAPSSH